MKKKVISILLVLMLLCMSSTVFAVNEKPLTIKEIKLQGVTNNYMELGSETKISLGVSNSSKDTKYRISTKYQDDTVVIKDYSPEKEVMWTANKPGVFTIIAEAVNDAGETSTLLKEVSVINPTKITIVETQFDLDSPQVEGEEITLDVSANGGTSPYEYSFTFKNTSASSEEEPEKSGYQANSDYLWKPQSSGEYQVTVLVRDNGGQITSKEYTYTIEDNAEHKAQKEKKVFYTNIAKGAGFVVVLIGVIVGGLKVKKVIKNKKQQAGDKDE